MRRVLMLAGIAAIGMTAAFAQGDAVAQRKQAMKDIGAAIGPLGKMMRGEDKFDLAIVQASLKVFSDKAPAAAKLFPAGSGAGDTKALPAVWTDNAKFQGIFTKFEADAKTAAAAIKDEASFKAEFGKVAGNCGACHNDFRAK